MVGTHSPRRVGGERTVRTAPGGPRALRDLPCHPESRGRLVELRLEPSDPALEGLELLAGAGEHRALHVELPLSPPAPSGRFRPRWPPGCFGFTSSRTSSSPGGRLAWIRRARSSNLRGSIITVLLSWSRRRGPRMEQERPPGAVPAGRSSSPAAPTGPSCRRRARRAPPLSRVSDTGSGAPVAHGPRRETSRGIPFHAADRAPFQSLIPTTLRLPCRIATP